MLVLQLSFFKGFFGLSDFLQGFSEGRIARMEGGPVQFVGAIGAPAFGSPMGSRATIRVANVTFT